VNGWMDGWMDGYIKCDGKLVDVKCTFY